MTDKNCPAYSKCVNNRCSCRHELAGNGETCKPRKLRFYALSPTKKKKIKRNTCHAGYSKCQYYWSTYRFYRRISVPKNGLFATFLLKNSVCKTMVIRVDQFYKVIEDFFFHHLAPTKDCSSSKQCHAQHGMCFEGKCYCVGMHVGDGVSCRGKKH